MLGLIIREMVQVHYVLPMLAREALGGLRVGPSPFNDKVTLSCVSYL